MIFKIYNSDFGVKLNGLDYVFDHVQDMQIEDPEFNRKIRGANASDKIGLTFKEGMDQPKRFTVTILGMSAALKLVLDAAFTNQTACDVYCIDRATGSSKMGKNAILCQFPQQISIDQSPESLNVILTFESFDTSETHKDA